MTHYGPGGRCEAPGCRLSADGWVYYAPAMNESEPVRLCKGHAKDRALRFGR